MDQQFKSAEDLLQYLRSGLRIAISFGICWNFTLRVQEPSLVPWLQFSNIICFPPAQVMYLQGKARLIANPSGYCWRLACPTLRKYWANTRGENAMGVKLIGPGRHRSQPAKSKAHSQWMLAKWQLMPSVWWHGHSDEASVLHPATPPLHIGCLYCLYLTIEQRRPKETNYQDS